VPRVPAVCPGPRRGAWPPRIVGDLTVVTCPLGALVGRRRDAKPPWTFPGGKIEPGESPEDAAVRESLEETGLQIRATGIIGSRVHPRTGVPIVYVAAVVVSEVSGQADGELAEVRWVSMAEAEELMGDMFAVVRQHLRRTSRY
jgi:8-oxo-dGTP pyrophosphatase MutT (NUDIX family)